MPLKSLRFTYGGRQLFLSSVGKKTAAELGLKDGSVIMVSCTQHQSTADEPAKQTTMSNMPRGTSSNTKRKSRGKKKASDHS